MSSAFFVLCQSFHCSLFSQSFHCSLFSVSLFIVHSFLSVFSLFTLFCLFVVHFFLSFDCSLFFWLFILLFIVHSCSFFSSLFTLVHSSLHCSLLFMSPAYIFSCVRMRGYLVIAGSFTCHHFDAIVLFLRIVVRSLHHVMKSKVRLVSVLTLCYS